MCLVGAKLDFMKDASFSKNKCGNSSPSNDGRQGGRIGPNCACLGPARCSRHRTARER